MLQPEIDLAEVDQPKSTRRKPARKRPEHPAEGLLDDSDLSPDDPVKKTAGQPDESMQGSQPPATSKVDPIPEIPPAPDQNETSPESSEKFSGNAIGEMPETITGDFPDPVDI